MFLIGKKLNQSVSEPFILKETESWCPLEDALHRSALEAD